MMYRPELTKTILTNIRNIRGSKSIQSKAMALLLGMKPSAYSKLECGMKRNWEQWLPKILVVLGVDTFDILQKTDTIQSSLVSHVIAANWQKQDENNKLIFKLMDEKIKDKDDTIVKLNRDLEYWQAKYYREKDRLEISEKGNAILRNQLKIKSKKSNTRKAVSFAIVGGG